jgi:hypothetical protein
MAGTVVMSTLSDGTNSTSSTNCIKGAPKAWANFNGTNGTVNDSYNVSSVTRNATGQYTVNMTNAMANVNYAPVVSVGFSTSGSYIGGIIAMFTNSTSPYTQAPTTSSFKFMTVYLNSSFSFTLDFDYVNVIVCSS